MADEKPQSTNVDFHLAIERTATGGAHLLADWSVRLPGNTFNVSIEHVSGQAVGDAIGFMSDLQRLMVDRMQSFGAVHGPGATLR